MKEMYKIKSNEKPDDNNKTAKPIVNDNKVENKA